MAALPLIATAVSAVATIGSTIVGFAGAQQQAAAAKNDAAYKAKQMTMQAQESRAASQREALETTRRSQLAQSQLQARAAASGAGATDETVIGLGEAIAGRGEYERLMQMYKGENQARGYEDAGAAAIATGNAEAKGAKLKGFGTILSGVGSLASTAGDYYNPRKLPSASSTYT
jgi:hypothetical protein